MDCNSDKALEAGLSLQRGEEKGFRFFFDKLYHQLHHYAFTITKDRISAEDGVEIAFVKLWENRKDLSQPKVIKSWLYTTTRNECLVYLAAFQRKKRLDRGVFECTPEYSDSHEEDTIKIELYDRLYSKINELPDACRKIFVMYYLFGISVKEICKKMNIKKSTVKNQKVRGMLLMRKKYSISDELVAAKEYRWVKSIFTNTNSNTQRAKLYGIGRHHLGAIKRGKIFCEITNQLSLETI
jgi:RNA polymerase sigma-70 factor, ECF subfamily